MSSSRGFLLACSLLAAGCTCNVPATLGDASWPCGADLQCPDGQQCVAGLCVAAVTGSGGSSGTGSSSGGSGTAGGTGGASSGGTSGLPAGAQCNGSSECQSGVCLGRCCSQACATGNAVCGIGLSCDAQGDCRYPADGAACERSCNKATNPEQETAGSCASGVCSGLTTSACPSGRPVCNQAGTACVPCYDVTATACGGQTCCDPATGNCVMGDVCPACILPTRPCTPNAGNSSGSCCTGSCCPDRQGDGGTCGSVCPGG